MDSNEIAWDVAGKYVGYGNEPKVFPNLRNGIRATTRVNPAVGLSAHDACDACRGAGVAKAPSATNAGLSGRSRGRRYGDRHRHHRDEVGGEVNMGKRYASISETDRASAKQLVDWAIAQSQHEQTKVIIRSAIIGHLREHLNRWLSSQADTWTGGSCNTVFSGTGADCGWIVELER